MSVVFLKEDRKDLIINQVNLHTRITLTDLANTLNVSEDTIRRDINDLADEGKLIKIRGGAMSKAYHYSSQPVESYAHDSKKLIAEKAVSLLKDGMLVLMGGGTTIREFIKMIPNELKATFLTVNPLTAVELLDKPNLEIIMIGGPISRYSQMAVGGDVYQRLSEIRVDLCIMGTNALDAKEGLTDSNWETVQAKKAMIRASEKIAILAISEKMNSVMSMKVADLREIDYLVTELSPESSLLAPYQTGKTLVI
ncbi:MULTISPECIES: DeoR/GlpR family DNA-binding transcription regulator [unclassified Siphonobacter]|uniref:DeoR/GlpR family DNA-binding transcription regulator n=1 Tax=unclassified Siphonobacter TaxID=2635712 RepID=UPI000CBDC5CF|nr:MULTISPECIES: DeoR/GlpR family DNA-binding transcription regulator [unclassified Siphonobacter]MDQ1086075.1 DeoR family fructose operon transcriptional repressor [Siphonobacter sp. SORGH_AS_1065]MDR6196398.1 DeoR family fructose operon transcriptional repressor [Siphonobacter sp. SORGH_AS_0500]PKK35259.1 DeoR family transcriptional regulator [Siphonobacter sp. SORGH_AS_0500]